LSEEQHEAQEPQEAGSRAVNRWGTPLTLRLEAEVGARFLEGPLDLPATEIPGDDLLQGSGRVGAEKGERVTLACWVAQQHPPHRQRRFAVAVPQRAVCGDLPREAPAGVPVDLGGQPGRRHGVRLREAVLPLDLTRPLPRFDAGLALGL